MTDEYRDNLQAALEYQDFVVCELYKRGIVIPLMGSSKYQIQVGESISGFEIKYDRKFRQTGNLYFEYQEKSDPRNPEFVESGILRKDNAWMWAIGDMRDIWLIPKKTLMRLCDRCVSIGGYAKRMRIRMVETSTSKGMLVPTELVTSEICAKHITVEQE